MHANQLSMHTLGQTEATKCNYCCPQHQVQYHLNGSVEYNYLFALYMNACRPSVSNRRFSHNGIQATRARVRDWATGAKFRARGFIRVKIRGSRVNRGTRAKIRARTTRANIRANIRAAKFTRVKIRVSPGDNSGQYSGGRLEFA